MNNIKHYTDREEIRAQAQEKNRLLAAERRNDLFNVLNSREGRRFLWRQLEACGTSVSSFNTNALQMAFNEGRRSVAVDLLNEMKQCSSELYELLIKENGGDNGKQPR